VSSVGGIGGEGVGRFDAGGAGADEAQGAWALPRSGWEDPAALEKAARAVRAEIEAARSRPNQRLRWIAARSGTPRTSLANAPASLQTGRYGQASKAHGAGTRPEPAAPVIAMKYGGPIHGGGGTRPPTPVIALKYGGPIHGGGGTKPPTPVIALKYGGPIHGGGGTRPPTPVIALKYGGPIHGGGGGGVAPVLISKYGAPTIGSPPAVHRP
jgi:hypothetical protein